MTRIHVEAEYGPCLDEQTVEIVERKGLGHPDSICDAIAEAVSRSLARAYLGRFGKVFHFNSDKAFLVAGSAEHRFGGGRILEPMKLILGDRATFIPNSGLDVPATAVETARKWITANLPHVDPLRHVEYQVEMKGGSEELTKLFSGAAPILGANDTSATVGFAPLTKTERTVLELEKYLNSSPFKEVHPTTGQDVKVMAVRTGRDLAITVAMPFLDKDVNSERQYFLKKKEVIRTIRHFLDSRFGGDEELTVFLNALDEPGLGLSGLYLTVLGTSAEGADSGQVGRGNHVHGLISLCRPGGAEATAGKNPVSHVGKIYNLFSHHVARKIHSEVDGLRQVTVWLCSRVGQPINQPQLASVRLHTESGRKLEDVDHRVKRLVEAGLDEIPQFCDRLIHGDDPVC